QGLSFADIAPRVNGLLGMSLEGARLESTSLGGQVLNPVIGAVGKHLQHSDKARELNMRDLSARFRIDGGRLHTTMPMRINTDEGSLSLSGSIGLDKTFALTGSLDIAP